MDLNGPVGRRTRRQCDLILEHLYAKAKGIEPSSTSVPEAKEDTSSVSDDDDDYSGESSEGSEDTDSRNALLNRMRDKDKKRVRDDDSAEVIVLEGGNDGEEEIGSTSLNFRSADRNVFVHDSDENYDSSRTEGGQIIGRGACEKGSRKTDVDSVSANDDYLASDCAMGLSSTEKDDCETGFTSGESEKKRRKKEVEEKCDIKNKECDENSGNNKGKCRALKLEGQGMDTLSKNLDIYELVANSIWVKNKPLECDQGDGEIIMVEARDQTSEKPHKEPLPLKFTFGIEEQEPVVKSEEEIELENLWSEMDFASKCEQVGSKNFVEVEDEHADRSGEANTGNLCSQGIHNLVLDEEIGIYCFFCSFVKVEIRYISPIVEKLPAEVPSKKISSKDGDISFDELHGNFDDTCDYISNGTVWSVIPGTRQSMYPHQQEGFEFMWRTLAGNTDLRKLKLSGSNGGGGGCIISHAPGTGKTRLTLVFLQSFLKLFPNCRPVILAPACLLLTWEEEFQKWNVGIPFHNMNNQELSGKESKIAMSVLEHSGCQGQIIPIRLVKLYSWINQASILGISYHLFEKLVGDKRSVGVKNEKLGKEAQMKKILLEFPDLLILDEGHIPRNRRSRIWNALTKLKTEKRIILSGTPFQNNFHELYNTLKIVRPAFEERIPLRLKQFGRYYYQSKRKLNLDEANEIKLYPGSSVPEDAIEELRDLMSPFVHVHKGNILQKSVPGLKDCIVVLNPGTVQKKLLGIIEHTLRSKNVLDFEHKLSMVSIHPALLLDCSLSDKEESFIENSSVGRSVLEKLRHNHNEGVKLTFLIEFVRLMQATKERVLVFSQFIPPLDLIMEQLVMMFSWSKGEEVLHMHGNLDHKERLSMIHVFNDPNSKAKVLLASTKACSEGISLIGASRVILLDVVWNPSVERQAISRAYRLGQKRVVFTYHLILTGTTEWEKYGKQTEKERISELVFTSTSKEDGEQKHGAVSSEDEVLDELVRHEKLKDVFKKIIYQPKEARLVESFS